jgi:hypothetical protein
MGLGQVLYQCTVCRKEGKGQEDHAASAERRAAPACLMGRRGGRSGHLPDVEERGAASAGNAGDERRNRATRGARCRGAQSCRAALRAGRGRRRAAEEKTKRGTGLGKTKGTWL